MPSQVNLQGGHMENVVQTATKFAVESRTLSGDITLDPMDATVQVIDDGGASRNVTLPASASNKGLMFLVVNATSSGATTVTLKDGANSIIALAINESALVVSDGGTWRVLQGAAT